MSSVGLVCEGVTDFTIIKSVLGFSLAQSGASPVFSEIQPGTDATSISSEGGWRLVYQWCLGVRRGGLTQFFEKPLFTQSKSYDIIIIHIDADMCEEFNRLSARNDHFINATNYDLSTSTGRRDYILATISRWLGVSDDEKRLVRLVAVECSETWLLAGMNSGNDIESDREAFNRFVRLVCARFSWTEPMNARSFGKNRQRYEKIISNYPVNFTEAFENCPILSAYAADLALLLGS